jgi:beta-lactam-binding protein with PASTA domain/serine/threonine protein kinase
VASPHLAEQVGRVLDGRYRVLAPIGTGASAAVYLADDTVLRRRVAIKVLHAALAADQGFLKRFQAEAHTAAALSHPNVMRVLDWGEGDEGPFLVLEYLGGGSLRSLLDRERVLSVEQAVSLTLQAARALDYAHRRGLVHRDIKPANLLFDEEGRVTIADFGLARALAEAAWTEPGGAVLGTARYAAPEQVRGHSLDGKADVYALGLVMYEMVTGRVPFTADTTIATLMARLDARVDIPAELGPLGEIVQAAMDPDHEERTSSADLVDQLETVSKVLPHPAPLSLPGALTVDVSNASDGDATMLPTATVPKVPADPSPNEESAPRQRRILRRHRSATPAPPAAVAAPEPKVPKVDTGSPADGAKTKRSHRRSLLGVAGVIVLVAGALSASAYYTSSNKQVVVPQLEGMSLADARARAKDVGLSVKVAHEVYSETVAAGTTLNEFPAADQKARVRDGVTVEVSKGPAPRDVPSTTGKSLDDATAALTAEGFTVTTDRKSDESVPNNQVMTQTPEAKAGKQPKGSEVHLVVSSGPRPRVVPDVKGLTQTDATARLVNLQLKVNVTQDYSDTVPVGSVISVTPGSGASVPRDTAVALVVSKGVKPIKVPNVLGRTFDAAKNILENVGLTTPSGPYGPPDGKVFAAKPSVDTEVPKGTSIALYTG